MLVRLCNPVQSLPLEGYMFFQCQMHCETVTWGLLLYLNLKVVLLAEILVFCVFRGSGDLQDRCMCVR